MITNFEEITEPLNEYELAAVPLMIKGFERHGPSNPIKAPDIVRLVNNDPRIKVKMTQPRLRKITNYIRAQGLLPLIATSNGYFVSHDEQHVLDQIRSLEERAGAILASARGLRKFAPPVPGTTTAQGMQDMIKAAGLALKRAGFNTDQIRLLVSEK